MFAQRWAEPTLPNQIRYRPELDGLRAIAITAVILYHAGFSIFAGGYVGVDIFFVISGYLITRILLKNLASGSFQFRTFYERRARRVLPALLLVITASIPFAWIWLPANEMQDFSQSVLFSVLFSSNILFWQESGYFATASELKPLLHTWSLGIEEQFYLIFPVIMLALWKFMRNRILASISLMAIFSFGISHLAVSVAPVAGFFLLPSRFWELALGSITAILMHQRGLLIKHQFTQEVLGWLGLLSLISAVFFFDSATPFPGMAALLPTLGTSLLIISAGRNTSVGKILSNPSLVGLGLISYSAYLWHYPAFAFLRRLYPEGPGAASTVATIMGVLAISYLTWKYVETPFRSGRRIGARNDGFVGALISTGLLTFALMGHASQGFRAPDQLVSEPPASSEISSSDFIVIGDSHAEHLIYGLERLTSGTVSNQTSAGCIPLRNVDRYDSRFQRGECAVLMNSYLDNLIQNDPDATLILSSMGPVYLDGTAFRGIDQARVTGLGVELIDRPEITDPWQVYELGLRSTFHELSQLRNTSVVFAIDVPELGIRDGCNSLGKEIKLGFVRLQDGVARDSEICELPREEYDSRSSRYKKTVLTVAQDFPAIKVFDPTGIFCDDSRCAGRDESRRPLYRDADHLSETGSLLVANSLINSLSKK